MFSLRQCLRDILQRFKSEKDYVVDRGVTNGWKYTKWNSGDCLIVLEEVKQISYTTSSTIMGGYGGNFTLTNTLPFQVITETAVALGEARNGSGIGWANISTASNKTIRGYVVSNNPQSSGGCLTKCVIYGKWK